MTPTLYPNPDGTILLDDCDGPRQADTFTVQHPDGSTTRIVLDELAAHRLLDHNGNRAPSQPVARALWTRQHLTESMLNRCGLTRCPECCGDGEREYRVPTIGEELRDCNACDGSGVVNMQCATCPRPLIGGDGERCAVCCGEVVVGGEGVAA